MDHSQISWNASDEVEVMDLFLSLPKPKKKILSNLSKILWNLIDKIARLCFYLEPRQTHVNERIIEIPFILQRLPESGHILDVGCSNSALALQLACMGYQVTGIDVRSYSFSHPNLKFYQEDISDISIQEESYDCAILISTVEHVGLGHYGDTENLSDREFLDSVARYVKLNGSIFITVPFGSFFECDWYRVYNSKKLSSLLTGYYLVDKKFFRRISLLGWQLCSEAELANVGSTSLPMNGVALVEIKKKSDADSFSS